MMRKSWTKWILTAVIALVLIVGVPIIINECYKTNSGYMTMWGAADALAYYGAIIASVGAAVGIYVSISSNTTSCSFAVMKEATSEHLFWRIQRIVASSSSRSRANSLIGPIINLHLRFLRTSTIPTASAMA